MTGAAPSSRRRTNRRGAATRESLLEAALTSLASGDPGSVSANRIAKDIGLTWGAVKYQFGDADGLWAAVLHLTAARRELPVALTPGSTVRERVTATVETLYRGLTGTDSRAVETLRAALPRDPAELERVYPQTAAELVSRRAGWTGACQDAFADLDVDPERVRKVASFLPGAVRGIISEKQLDPYTDAEEVRSGLTAAVIAYLERSR